VFTNRREKPYPEEITKTGGRSPKQVTKEDTKETLARQKKQHRTKQSRGQKNLQFKKEKVHWTYVKKDK
jgi:hypothetical protein